MKKFNPLDGDRAAEYFDKIAGEERSKKILKAFNDGIKSAKKQKYNNIYFDDERLAYNNGWNSIKNKKRITAKRIGCGKSS